MAADDLISALEQEIK